MFCIFSCSALHTDGTWDRHWHHGLVGFTEKKHKASGSCTLWLRNQGTEMCPLLLSASFWFPPIFSNAFFLFPCPKRYSCWKIKMTTQNTFFFWGTNLCFTPGTASNIYCCHKEGGNILYAWEFCWFKGSFKSIELPYAYPMVSSSPPALPHELIFGFNQGLFHPYKLEFWKCFTWTEVLYWAPVTSQHLCVSWTSSQHRALPRCILVLRFGSYPNEHWQTI